MSQDDLYFNPKTEELEYRRPTYGGWRAMVGWIMMAVPTLLLIAVVAYMLLFFAQLQWGINFLDYLPGAHR